MAWGRVWLSWKDWNLSSSKMIFWWIENEKITQRLSGLHCILGILGHGRMPGSFAPALHSCFDTPCVSTSSNCWCNFVAAEFACSSTTILYSFFLATRDESWFARWFFSIWSSLTWPWEFSRIWLKKAAFQFSRTFEDLEGNGWRRAIVVSYCCAGIDRFDRFGFETMVIWENCGEKNADSSLPHWRFNVIERVPESNLTPHSHVFCPICFAYRLFRIDIDDR